MTRHSFNAAIAAELKNVPECGSWNQVGPKSNVTLYLLWVKTGNVLIEQKISALTPKADIYALMSTRPNQPLRLVRRRLLSQRAGGFGPLPYAQSGPHNCVCPTAAAVWKIWTANFQRATINASPCNL